MKRAAWASALIIALLGLGAALLVPERLPGGRAANPWETGRAPPPTAGPAQPGVLLRVADDTVLRAAFDPATGRSLPFGPSEPPPGR